MLDRVPDNQIALTFDDGPDPRFTSAILDILAQWRVPATFFMLGEAARRHPALVRRVVAEGHTLASHGYRHVKPRRLSRDAHGRDLARSVAVLRDIAGVDVHWYRPAHGNLTPETEALARGLGLTVVLWNRSAVDWGPLAYRRGIARRLGGATGGDIVLMHDGRRRINRPGNTAAVLPAFLASLIKAGPRPVALDQLLPRNAETATAGGGLPAQGS